jgi:hypothetical protein
VLIIFLSNEANSWRQKFKRGCEDELLWHFGSQMKSYHCVTNDTVVAENYVARQWDSSKIIHELLLLQLKVKVPNVWTVNLLSDQVSHTAQQERTRSTLQLNGTVNITGNRTEIMVMTHLILKESLYKYLVSLAGIS